MTFQMHEPSLQAGGRTRVRRLFVPAAVLVCAALGPPAIGALAAADPHVSVREQKGIYMVAATFSVSQPAAVVLAVLTDYEQIPRFMPDVRTSQVLERSEHGAVIEQEAVARFMMFSRRIHLVLDVREGPGTVRFRDRCGESFAHYEGAWTVTEKDGRAAIAYELTAKPSFAVPEFLLKRLLTRDATRMIERLQGEIAVRQGGRASRP